MTEDTRVNRMDITEAYRQVIEEQQLDYASAPEELNELRILRGASALVFAKKSKAAGDKVVQSANRGKNILKRFRTDMNTNERVEVIQEALDEMFNALIENRKQMGNLVGVALSSALISERSSKELQKIIMKTQKGRR